MEKIVVLTGAGISAESGVKTFRDNNGLWENHKIEEVATPEAWHKNPKLVLEFYNQRRKQLFEVEPNNGHKALVELENLYDVQIIAKKLKVNFDKVYENEYLDIINRAKGRRSIGCSLSESSHVMQVIEGIRRSSSISSSVKLPLY